MKNQQMAEKKYIVYKHTGANGKCYVGQTCQTPNNRFRHGSGYKGTPHFYAAIKKYGWDYFTHEVVADNLTKKEADWLEKYLIAYYHSDEKKHGYNISDGGASASGVKPSAKHIQQLKDLLTGKPLSDEHRKKISEGLRAYRKQTGICAKQPTPKPYKRTRALSEGKTSWNRNKHLSDEHKAHLKASTLNRKDMSKPVTCVETGLNYPSASEAARQLLVDASQIRLCCLGQRYYKTAGGYHWKYVA